jgi:PAS domain S-box-containing protein
MVSFSLGPVNLHPDTDEDAVSRRAGRSERHYDDLVSQVRDYAIIGLDPHGAIETWNLGAERLKGYTAAESVGHNFEMFYGEDDRRAGLPAGLLLVAREQGRVEHSGWRVRKDGTRFWGDVVITAVRDSEGAVTGFTKVTRDRSEVKALEQAQDAFYAAFTHDFRTPVASLMAYVDALRYAPEDDREALIERVETNAERLLLMVEGLVEFAQQRAAHVTMLTGDIDVAQVARSVVRDLAPSLRPERVLAPSGVVMATANGVALHRVLTNLVVNALKYSPGDSEVVVLVNAAETGRVALAVRDHGRGIDPGDLGSIFEEFSRGRLAEDDGGTGLGLASVRELVEEQRGSVRIESELGVGTTVTVELPGPLRS